MDTNESSITHQKLLHMIGVEFKMTLHHCNLSLQETSASHECYACNMDRQLPRPSLAATRPLLPKQTDEQ